MVATWLRPLYRRFYTARASAKRPDLRFHDLRHSHATQMLSNNVHPKIASERLGHSKVSITLDLYSHVIPGMQEVLLMATTITSKGQVTVPKKIRDYLGLRTGSAVTFERLASGEIVMRPTKPKAKLRTSVFAKLRGRATVRMKTDEIMALTRGV